MSSKFEIREVTLLPIRLTLAGGIGNQLFQLSAGIYLEEKLGRQVVYDISNVSRELKAEIGNYTRSLEIEELILDNLKINRRYALRYDHLLHVWRRFTKPESEIFEIDPNFDVLGRVNDKTKAVYGYFQSSKIVSESWPILKSKLEHSSKFSSLIDSGRVERIAIHLRFGDYSDDPKTKSIHGLTSTRYFEQAIRALKSKNRSDIPILFVTDDQDKANDFIGNLDGVTDVQIISNANPIDDLVEICRSSNVVITNSTFSWWGGWIASEVHNSMVIYPRPWFADSSDPEIPVYVSGWTGIKREFSDI